MQELNSTAGLLAFATAIMDTLIQGGMEAVTEAFPTIRKRGPGYLSNDQVYVGLGSNKAEWEVIVEHYSGVSVLLRSYKDGKRIARWAIGSQENVGREAAMAALVNYYCQKS
jgi:hypothetical protein